MVKVFCDRCKNIIDLWNVKIIATRWKDESGHEIGEVCSDCAKLVEEFIRGPKKEVSIVFSGKNNYEEK